MSSQLYFFASIGLSLIAWGVVTSQYLWPRLRILPRADALRPLLILHSFRFVGFAFLVPGVVSPDLPAGFARSAAFGDVIAALLALVALSSQSRSAGVAVVWLFNLWGAADLVNAFYQANASGLSAGQLGAAYFIVTLLVPLLLITHGVAFRILLRREPVVAMRERRLSA
jgi:hypothetical protein